MKIKVDGKDVTKLIGSPEWSTDDETNGQEMSFSSLYVHDVGSHVKVTDGGKVRFYGVIVSMEENIKPPHTYRALDFSYNLKGDEIIQFKKLAADEAIKKLLGNQGIACEVCSIPTKISKIYKDSVVNILKDILRIAKRDQGKAYCYEIDGTKVIVKEKKKEKISPSFIMSGESSISRSIEDLRNEVKIAKENKVLATASDKTSIAKIGTIRMIEDAKEKTTTAKAKSQAEKLLSEMDRMKSSKAVDLIVTKGYWNIKKNRLIKLKGGGLNGWYRIRSSRHTIEGNVHKVEIEVSWDAKL